MNTIILPDPGTTPMRRYQLFISTLLLITAGIIIFADMGSRYENAVTLGLVALLLLDLHIEFGSTQEHRIRAVQATLLREYPNVEEWIMTFEEDDRFILRGIHTKSNNSFVCITTANVSNDGEELLYMAHGINNEADLHQKIVTITKAAR